MIEVRVQAEPFEPGIELARLEGLAPGAVASFTGLVRGAHRGNNQRRAARERRLGVEARLVWRGLFEVVCPSLRHLHAGEEESRRQG